jgi:DNA-binding beta-propeller fold protein YncE
MRCTALRALMQLPATLIMLSLFAGQAPCQQPKSAPKTPPAKAAQAQAAPSPTPAFHQIAKYNIGGEGGWDYLAADSISRRLYIARSNRVIVFDLDKGTVAGEIPNTNGVHGVAVANDLGRGFASCGQDGKVLIFDLKTLKPIGEVKVGTGPDAIIYDLSISRVFAFNGGSSDATAIDAAKGTVAGSISLGGRPEFAASDGRGTVYVNIEDKNEVVAFDAKKLAVKARWPVAPGAEPSGLAMDREHRRLFIGCGNKKMIVMDPDTGRVIAALPIGDGVDANGYDPATELAFSSNGDGTLTVVHEDSPDKFTVVDNVKTEQGARTMAIDYKKHTVILVTADFTPPPAATAERPHPRPGVAPDSFRVLVYGK